MKLAPLLHKKAIAVATSAGCPKRLSDDCSIESAPRNLINSVVIGVSMIPGDTAFTRVRGPSSRAKLRVNDKMAPFVAE